ncbi:MAG: cell wall-binding repeat-containing protein [Clostridium lundense]|nr:cell wall-binding repeat-containing protein [Clostridium lundense]
MKKRNRALASATVLSLVLTSTVTATNVQAAAEVTRVPGANREATAMEVAKQAFGTAETVVLVNGYGYADAVSATPLAKALNAPILLTNKVDAPTAELKATLATLGAKKVVIVGGTGAVTSDMETALKANYTVERIGGASRYETNAAVATKVLGLTKATSGVLVNGQDGYADALSVASIAATKGMPVLFGNKNEVPAAVKTVATGLDMVAVGGAGVLPASVLKSVDAERVAEGANRFETNLAVLDHFKGDLKLENIYVAAGGATQTQFADALVASAAAAKVAAPVLLTGAGANATAVEKANDYIEKNITDKTKVTVIGGTGSVSEAIFNDIKEIADPNSDPDTTKLAVKEVKATAVNAFKVTFNKAAADTSKVTFEVKQSTNPVTVSVTWNEAKTEATLAKSSNFVMGDYTVNVKNEATDLGTSKVTIAEQKIAKIEMTSTKLGVYTDKAGKQTGYATYKVFDQYANDITNSALSNNIQFNTGVGTVTARKGLITIEPGTLNLLTFTSGVVITANDTTSGVSATANLAVTSQIGTLSDIKLTKLTNAEGKELTAGDISSVFYAEYTATDISGNDTRNFDLIKQGLILSGDGNDELTTSHPNVTAKVVQDPADSTKAVIEVRANNDEITMDMPLVITAMTWTGKTSQLNTTLKKQAEVDTLTLFAPEESIASGEEKEIPFIAKDQNGKELTKWSEIVGSDVSNPIVKLTGAHYVRNSDGTVTIKNDAKTNNGTNPIPTVISAVTKTGHYSSITVNIQKPVLADELKLDTAVLKSIMQAQEKDKTNGATQSIDFGWDNGGLIVKDQYGREIDMTTRDNEDYKVVATTTNPAVVQLVNSNNTATTGQTKIEIKAGAVGSATVKFELQDASGKVIDTKSQVFTVLADKDITDYTIDTVAKPIYVVNTKGSNVTDKEAEYKANPKVYGTTSTGAKVVLRGTPVVGATVTNDDFTVFTTKNNVNVVGAEDVSYKGVKIVANELDDKAKTGSSTTLTVTVLGADGLIHTVTTDITSSTEKPKAVSMDTYVETSVRGISRDEDTITLAPIGGTYADLLGNYLTKYDKNGAATKQNVYFCPVDQYGKEGSELSRVTVVAAESNLNGHTFTVDSKGEITANTAQAGDYVTISGVTSNGLVSTIKLVFAGSPSDVETVKPEIKNPTVGLAGKDADKITVTSAANNVYTVDLSKVDGSATFSTLKMEAVEGVKPDSIKISANGHSKDVKFAYDFDGKIVVDAAQFLPADTSIDALKDLVGDIQTIKVDLSNDAGTTTYTVNLKLQ